MWFFFASETRSRRNVGLACAVCGLVAVALAVILPWTCRRPRQSLVIDTLDSACDAARRLGWEVQRPFQDPDGPGAVLIDRAKNPAASSMRGVGEPGLVYVVQTETPREAEASPRPCTVWGRLRLFGDPEMINRMLDQGFAHQ